MPISVAALTGIDSKQFFLEKQSFFCNRLVDKT